VRPFSWARATARAHMSGLKERIRAGRRRSRSRRWTTACRRGRLHASRRSSRGTRLFCVGRGSRALNAAWCAVLCRPRVVHVTSINRTYDRPCCRTCAVVGSFPRSNGGAKGTRTPDPHTASVMRYQLRHSPKCSPKVHHRPGCHKNSWSRQLSGDFRAHHLRGRVLNSRLAPRLWRENPENRRYQQDQPTEPKCPAE
jgi:hypothetical protein